MDTDELRQFVVQKRELLARETFSRRAFNRCENMSDELKTHRYKDTAHQVCLAERAVRPFTTKRKHSLHFGSDEGAEIAAVYHGIISTVKLQGRSEWDYLGYFLSEFLTVAEIFCVWHRKI